ncbi:MAG TPA: NADH-quinone oxidoreductase subunit D [Anaerolineae bacterium]|nr:NADH-quinone oxidoreductase subunit D [Anaerolineae bacterium]
MSESSLSYEDAVPGAVITVQENGSLIVSPEKLVELGVHLRNNEGYDYLSSVTGVDYLGYPGRTDTDRFEVVYHLYSTKRGGGPLVLKVRLPAEDPVVPSLVKVWPGAELQEREVYDMYGVRFADHPNMRRVLLWEGFHGHPLRKDWHEPYYEADSKPFRSRHPEGHYVRAEERAPWHDNVQYPPGFDPHTWEEPPLPYLALQRRTAGNGNGSGPLHTEQVVVNMGPQHPSTHGVFRMIVSLQGETITALEPEMGYLHRNHEKIGERNTYLQNIPYTDRLDYINSMSNNLGYVLAVEKLMGDRIQVPERAEYIRVIMAELTRLVNHFIAIGFLFNDLGAFYTPALYGLEERELILDLFEAASGSRMMCNYMRFGGVARDLPDGFVEGARELVFNRLPKVIDEFETYLTGNELFMARSQGVGYLAPEDAIALSATGPLLRGSGVPYDIRKAEPYSIYDRFDFNVVTHDGCDVYARYMVRIGEMRESIKIIQQALDQLPEGEIQGGKKAYQVRVPEGEAYARIEAPKGELGFYVVSSGKPNPWRYHVRAPSFINLTSLGPMCVGYKVADSVIILGSIDIVLGEVDR